MDAPAHAFPGPAGPAVPALARSRPRQAQLSAPAAPSRTPDRWTTPEAPPLSEARRRLEDSRPV
ncbi:hypothetical protein KQY30_21890 [Streptomyces sp. GMY02]|uniref:hypothetical protein n=1 Tax=Streptomyces sp. GMY02 TaxID=1333528 RepID=UPI001C2C61F7|nr:hypothetical protein [Streptomyces sp. GMY02]QXE36487.1 hypothetical protein KQY30_21890 [Streptomyces sp. GMY02]